MECGPLRKGTCPQRGSSVGRWLAGGWFPSMGGNSRRVPSCPTIPQLVPCLSPPPPPHSRGWPRPATVVVLGSVSHGHSVYISSAPESRSPSLHSRPKVAHLQRLMCLAAHLRNRAFYGSQREILLTQPHTIESWRRVRSAVSSENRWRLLLVLLDGATPQPQRTAASSEQYCTIHI